MNIKSILNLTLLVFLLSCKEDEEPSPNSRMEGRWEQISEINRLYENYNFLEFKTDGTFFGEMAGRDIESKELLGYRGVFNGSYRVEGNILIFTEEVLFSKDFDAPGINDDSFVPKEDLIPNSQTSEISYRIVKDFSELNFICPEGENTGCTEFTTYIKVD